MALARVLCLQPILPRLAVPLLVVPVEGARGESRKDRDRFMAQGGNGPAVPLLPRAPASGWRSSKWKSGRDVDRNPHTITYDIGTSTGPSEVPSPRTSRSRAAACPAMTMAATHQTATTSAQRVVASGPLLPVGLRSTHQHEGRPVERIQITRVTHETDLCLPQGAFGGLSLLDPSVKIDH